MLLPVEVMGTEDFAQGEVWLNPDHIIYARQMSEKWMLMLSSETCFCVRQSEWEKIKSFLGKPDAYGMVTASIGLPPKLLPESKNRAGVNHQEPFTDEDCTDFRFNPN